MIDGLSSLPLAVILLLLMAIIAVCMVLITVSITHHPGRKHTRTAEISVTPAPIRTGTAVLIQKIDDRRRVIDEYHHSSIHDEHFELVFQMKNGEIIRLDCSKASYREMPFHQTGTITYQGGRLIKFKSSQNIISDEYVAA